jgi:hypothetical protein
VADTTAQAVDEFEAATALILDEQPAEKPEEETLEADAEEQVEEDDATDDEADEAEADEAEAEDDDDDEEAEELEEEPAPELYTVKVDGVEKQVTLDELRRGYSGQEYIQTQMRQVAEGRKEVEAIYTALQNEAQQVAALRQRLEAGNFPQQPTPPSRELFDADPIGYMEAKLKYDEDLAEWQKSAGELEQVSQRQKQMEQQALQYHLAQEMQKLQQAIPEFGDREKATQLRQAILETGQFYGYEPGELNEVSDSRAVRILHDAMKYRQMMAAQGEVQKKVEKARPVVKPGAKKSATTGKVKQRKQAVSRMKQTGSIDDVAKFLLS